MHVDSISVPRYDVVNKLCCLHVWLEHNPCAMVCTTELHACKDGTNHVHALS